MILLDKALQYCKDVMEGKEITTWEVKRQCEIFLEDYNTNQYREDFKYYADEKQLKKINNLLKLLNYATGFVAGKQVLKYLVGFQCFLVCGVFLFRYKDNPHKFMHNDITLFLYLIHI
ncbi:terminase large subunit, partial [Clostridium autoethanogenum]